MSQASTVSPPDTPNFMKGQLLCQCILENTNSDTKGILVTLPLDSSVETMLERMSRVPVGQQALLVEAIQAVGRDLVQAQSQAFAALAPLRPPGATAPPKPVTTTGRDFLCYRCGKPGHTRDRCRQRQVWCRNCQQGTHKTNVCRQTGNEKPSARSCSASTPIATPVTFTTPPPGDMTNSYRQTPCYNPPPEGASAWTWQQQ